MAKHTRWYPKPAEVSPNVSVYRCKGCKYITQGDGPLCRICVSKGIATATISQAQPEEKDAQQ
jgi:hypothetical protein